MDTRFYSVKKPYSWMHTPVHRVLQTATQQLNMIKMKYLLSLWGRVITAECTHITSCVRASSQRLYVWYTV